MDQSPTLAYGRGSYLCRRPNPGSCCASTASRRRFGMAVNLIEHGADGRRSPPSRRPSEAGSAVDFNPFMSPNCRTTQGGRTRDLTVPRRVSKSLAWTGRGGCRFVSDYAVHRVLCASGPESGSAIAASWARLRRGGVGGLGSTPLPGWSAAGAAAAHLLAGITPSAASGGSDPGRRGIEGDAPACARGSPICAILHVDSSGWSR